MTTSPDQSLLLVPKKKNENERIRPYDWSGPCTPDLQTFWISLMIVVTGFAANGMVAAANYSRRYIQSPENYKLLPDVLHEFLPEWEHSIIHEIGIYVPPVVIYFLVATRHKRVMTLTRRFFLSWGVSLWYRATTIALTSLPDPSHECKGANPISGDPYHAAFILLTTCGDLIFSGHTTLAVCTLWLVVDAYPIKMKYSFIHICAFSITFGAILIISCTRLHYTIDIWLGIGVPTVYRIVHHTMIDSPRFHWLCKEGCERDRYTYCGSKPKEELMEYTDLLDSFPID